jgi:hypothetical protein
MYDWARAAPRRLNMRFPSFHRLVVGVGLAAGLGAAGCGQSDATATAYLTWQIVDAKAANPNTAPALTCDQKGVMTVRVQLVPSENLGPFDFPCASMAGETYTVPAGTYTIETIALGTSYQALAQLTFTQRLFGRTSLGLIIFQVN